MIRQAFIKWCGGIIQSVVPVYHYLSEQTINMQETEHSLVSFMLKSSDMFPEKRD